MLEQNKHYQTKSGDEALIIRWHEPTAREQEREQDGYWLAAIEDSPLGTLYLHYSWLGECLSVKDRSSSSFNGLQCSGYDLILENFKLNLEGETKDAMPFSVSFSPLGKR